jgi:hypothetical protein
MRRASTMVLTLLFLAAVPIGAAADTFIDTFEGGANQAGWSFIQGADVLESSGGNPGWWLHQPVYDTFAPILNSAWGNATPFAGDYRAANVTRIRFDAQTIHLDFGDGSGFEMVLLLRNTHGTPNDFDDDDFAYFVGPNIPLVGQGWVHYDFDIPSQSNDPVPPGWHGGWSGDCENFRPGVTWANVMSNVDRVEFWWLNPCFFAIFQQWNVGADNVAIEYGNPTAVDEATWGKVKARFGE